LVYCDRGKRVLKPFTTIAAAKEGADQVLQRPIQGEPEAVVLSGSDRLAFLRAKGLLEPSAIPVDVAVAGYNIPSLLF